MNEITDTDRLDWIINNQIDIEAPEYGESRTWCVYNAANSLGEGLACHSNLRKAIDIAIKKCAN